MFIDRSKFRDQILKRVTRGTFLWNYFKFWQVVSEKKIFLRICSCLYSECSPHSLEPCLMTDQNIVNTFWEGSLKEHSCEIISKSDQRFRRGRFLKTFFLSVQCKKAPIYQNHVYWLIKISQTIFVQGRPRTLLWNYFIMSVQCKKTFFLSV